MTVADAVPLYLTIVMVVLCIYALMGKGSSDSAGGQTNDNAELTQNANND